MKTVTVDQFLMFGACYSERKIRSLLEDKNEWNALEILVLDNVPAKDRLWAVLREEFIDAPILHEFACRCAEEALERVDKPDPRSIAAIEAKRAWLRGKITDDKLKAAYYAACGAAWDAAYGAARDAAYGAAYGAARDAARDAACYAARDAARDAACYAASGAAWDAAYGAARDAARDAAYDETYDEACKKQVDMLVGMLADKEKTVSDCNR